MEFSEDYHQFFDNHGRCPDCKAPMVLHIGCINPDCMKFIEKLASKKVSNLQTFNYLRYLLTAKIKTMKSHLRKRNERNLDKTQKKVYIKDNDTRI